MSGGVAHARVCVLSQRQTRRVGGTERRPSGRHTSRNRPSEKQFVPATRAMFVWLDALWARFKSLRLRTTFKRQVVPKVVLDTYAR